MTEEVFDVVIIGAGMAGLRAALHLRGRTDSVRLLERDTRVGGRVQTDRENGFLLDRGFQVFPSAYPEARDVLHYEELELQPFHRGCLVHKDGQLESLVNPLSHPSYLLSTLTARVGTPMDLWRLWRLRRRMRTKSVRKIEQTEETTTRARLESLEFSPSFIDDFFRPFFSGVFLEEDLATSSRMFEFVFKMFASGPVTLPAEGMQSLPRQMAEGLPEGWLRVGSRVAGIDGQTVHLADGSSLEGRAILVATNGQQAKNFTGVPGRESHRSTSCVYFELQDPPVTDPVLIVNAEPEQRINTLCFPSLVSARYSPEDRHLASVSSLADEHPEKLTERIHEELVSWFGSRAARWNHLRTDRIPYSLPQFNTGENPLRTRPVRVRDGLYVAGDHRDYPSLNGALRSGRRAAEAIDEDVLDTVSMESPHQD